MSKQIFLTALVLLAGCQGNGAQPDEPSKAITAQNPPAALDTRAPQWREVPDVVAHAGYSARLEFQLDEAAEVGYRLVPSNASAALTMDWSTVLSPPESADMDWSRWNWSDGEQLESETAAQRPYGAVWPGGVTGGIARTSNAGRASIALTGLVPGTHYRLAIQARDGSGNRQATIYYRNFRTPFLTMPAVAWTSGRDTSGMAWLTSHAVSPETVVLRTLDKKTLGYSASEPFVVNASADATSSRRVYAFKDNELFRFNTDPYSGQLQLEQTLTLECPAQSATRSARSTMLYVVCKPDSGSGTTRLLSLSVDNVDRSLHLAGALTLAGQARGPLLLDPRGEHAWLAMPASRRVQKLGFASTSHSLQSAASWPLTSQDFSLSLDPAGIFLYVADREKQQLTRYRTDGRYGLAPVAAAQPLPCDRGAPAFSPNGGLAFFANTTLTSRVDSISGAIQLPDGVDAPSCADLEYAPQMDQTASFIYDTASRGGFYVQRVDMRGAEVKTMETWRINDPLGSNWSSIAFGAAAVPGVFAAQVPHFALTTNYRNHTLTSWRIDAASGALTAVAVVSTGQQPSDIEVDHAARIVYVSNYGSDSISAWSIDAESGQLTLLGDAATDRGPRALAIDQRYAFEPFEGRRLVVMNQKGTSLQHLSYRTDMDGSHMHQQIGFTATPTVRVPIGRQPLSLALLPDGQTLLLGQTLATESAYRWDYTSWQNLEFGSAVGYGQPSAAIGMDRGGRFAFLLDPVLNMLFTRQLQGYGHLPYDLQNSPAVQHLAPGSQALITEPTGRFVYVSNVNSDSINGYRIDQDSGLLSPLGFSINTGRDPGILASDPQGRFLYALNNASGTISVFAINGSSGKLGRKATIAAQPGLSAMDFFSPAPAFNL